MIRLARLLFVLLCAVGLSMTSRAGYGFFADSGSFIILNINNAGNTYYYLSPTSGANLQFNGHDFGSFEVGVNSFVLNGFENNTYENGTGGIMTGRLNYRIYPTGSPSGSYTTINHVSYTNLGSGNERHYVTTANVNVLSGLTPGYYTLEVFPWAEATWNNTEDPATVNDQIYADNTSIPDATRYQSASESPYYFTANFNIPSPASSVATPEPNVAVFACLGAVVLRLIVRKRR